MRTVPKLFLTGCAAVGLCALPPAAPHAAPSAKPSPFLYVANQGSAKVTIIDTRADTVYAVIDLQTLGFGPNAKPHHIAVEPDGSAWYVSLIGENVVLKFDAENRLVGRAAFETPGMLAVHPTNGRLYVGRSMTAVNPPPRFGVITRATMDIDEIDVLFPRPHALILDPSGDRLYVSSMAANQIATFDTRTDDLELTPVTGPTQALVQFAISPDGTTMVAGGELTGDFLIFDISHPPAVTQVGKVKINAQPFVPVYSPDGKRVFIPNKGASTVTVVDVPGRKVLKVISGEGIAQPDGSALSPDGSRLYISNNYTGTGHDMSQPGGAAAQAHNGTIVVINTATYEIEKVIPVPPYAAGLGTAW